MQLPARMHTWDLVLAQKLSSEAGLKWGQKKACKYEPQLQYRCQLPSTFMLQAIFVNDP